MRWERWHHRSPTLQKTHNALCAHYQHLNQLDCPLEPDTGLSAVQPYKPLKKTSDATDSAKRVRSNNVSVYRGFCEAIVCMLFTLGAGNQSQTCQ